MMILYKKKVCFVVINRREHLVHPLLREISVLVKHVDNQSFRTGDNSNVVLKMVHSSLEIKVSFVSNLLAQNIERIHRTFVLVVFVMTTVYVLDGQYPSIAYSER